MTNAFNSSSSFLTTPSLLDRVRAHDADAWQRLTSLFGPLIFHWLRARGLGEHDAADVLQEVFASIARSLHTFKPGVERGFRGWIWTIARSRLADFYRRRAREAQAIDGSDVWNRLADETARLTEPPTSSRKRSTSMHSSSEHWISSAPSLKTGPGRCSIAASLARFRRKRLPKSSAFRLRQCGRRKVEC